MVFVDHQESVETVASFPLSVKWDNRGKIATLQKGSDIVDTSNPAKDLVLRRQLVRQLKSPQGLSVTFNDNETLIFRYEQHGNIRSINIYDSSAIEPVAHLKGVADPSGAIEQFDKRYSNEQNRERFKGKGVMTVGFSIFAEAAKNEGYGEITSSIVAQNESSIKSKVAAPQLFDSTQKYEQRVQHVGNQLLYVTKLA